MWNRLRVGTGPGLRVGTGPEHRVGTGPEHRVETGLEPLLVLDGARAITGARRG